MKLPPRSDAVVERMVFLARQLGNEAPDSARELEFMAALPSSVLAHRAQQRRRRLTRSALVLAACLAPLVVWLSWRARSPLTFQVSSGVLAEGYILGRSATRVAFSDGSELKIRSGARARVGAVTAHGAQVELAEGEVTVDVVKAPGNAWSVRAGSYQVHVIGTAFDVRYTEQDHRLQVDLHRGSVVVTGSPIRGQLRLSPGQRLTSGSDGTTVTALPPMLGESEAQATTAPATRAESPASSESDREPERGPPAEPSPEPGIANERRDPGPPGLSVWPRWVAQGDFQQVLDAAARRGIDNVLSSGAQVELAALADAARYGRNMQLARRALLTERKRFPKASAARGVTFFLGGIEPDGSAAALAWYEAYLSESPNGHYAPQALGQRMMLVHRRSGSDASAPLARDYLRHFPQGPYASTARKILQRSPE